MTKRRRAPHVIGTTGSALFDLFEPAEAERLTIQSGLALALEREIEARKWTQPEAARRIGINQPRVNDLVRGRLDKFSDSACSLPDAVQKLRRAEEDLPVRHRR